jgi:hypothetical protein
LESRPVTSLLLSSYHCEGLGRGGRHGRSTNTLSIQRPQPSIEMRTPGGGPQHAGEGGAGALAALVGVEDLLWATLLRCPSCPQPYRRAGGSCLRATLPSADGREEHCGIAARFAVFTIPGAHIRPTDGSATAPPAAQRCRMSRPWCWLASTPHRRARPVHDRHQIEEASANWDVGDVGAPGLVRSLNRQGPATDMGISCVPLAACWCTASGRALQCPSCASTDECACD